MEDIKFGTISKDMREKIEETEIYEEPNMNNQKPKKITLADVDSTMQNGENIEFTSLKESLEALKKHKNELTDKLYCFIETKLCNLAKENIYLTEHDIKNNIEIANKEGSSGVDRITMFEKVANHSRRMRRDPEYCKKIEKDLYKGLPSEYYEKVEQEYEYLKKELKSKGVDIDKMVKQEVEEVKKKMQEESETQGVTNSWKM